MFLKFWCFFVVSTVYAGTICKKNEITYKYISVYPWSHWRHCHGFYDPRWEYGSFHNPSWRSSKIAEKQTVTCINVTANVFLDYKYEKDLLSHILIITNSTLPVVPKNSFFFNATGFDKLILKNLSIEDVTLGAFDNMTRLAVLDLSDNKLVKVPEELLNKTTLVELDLSKNRIASVQHTNFSRLINLKILNLRGNHLVVISGDVFMTLINLEKIDVSDNPLVMFSGVNFNCLTTLIAENTTIKEFDSRSSKQFDKIELSHGILESVDFNDFSNVSRLLLNDNKINSIKNWESVSVETLILQNNSLSRLDDLPKNVRFLLLPYNNIANTLVLVDGTDSNLKSLTLSFNKLTVSINFVNYINLMSYDVSSNLIDILYENTFVNCTSLETVDFSSNRIKYIQSNVFVNVPSLKSLILENNYIKSMNYFMVIPENKITELLIKNNQIVTLDVEIFHYSFGSLKSISMNDNPWYCEDLNDILYNFKLRNIYVKDKLTNVTPEEGSNQGIKCKYNKKS